MPGSLLSCRQSRYHVIFSTLTTIVKRASGKSFFYWVIQSMHVRTFVHYCHSNACWVLDWGWGGVAGGAWESLSDKANQAQITRISFRSLIYRKQIKTPNIGVVFLGSSYYFVYRGPNQNIAPFHRPSRFHSTVRCSFHRMLSSEIIQNKTYKWK